MNLCYEIASRVHKRKIRRNAGQRSRARDPGEYWQWQFDSSERYLAEFWDLYEQLPGKRLLDIGCGLGGRTCYLAGRGVGLIVGMDINRDEVAAAEQLACRRLNSESRGKVRFQSAAEDRPPELEPFDIVLLIDSLEHAKNPVAMLDLAWSLTRPGGLCYFGTRGWHHHGASHLDLIVPIPFATLFFSDAQILEAVRKIVGSSYYEPTMWDSDPPVKRWEGVTDLSDRPGEYLNKITIRGIRSAVRRSKFGAGRIRVKGFGWRRMPVLRCFNFLARVPVIQEAYHSGVFGRLERRQ